MAASCVATDPWVLYLHTQFGASFRALPDTYLLAPSHLPFATQYGCLEPQGTEPPMPLRQCRVSPGQFRLPGTKSPHDSNSIAPGVQSQEASKELSRPLALTSPIYLPLGTVPGTKRSCVVKKPVFRTMRSKEQKSLFFQFYNLRLGAGRGGSSTWCISGKLVPSTKFE